MVRFMAAALAIWHQAGRGPTLMAASFQRRGVYLKNQIFLPNGLINNASPPAPLASKLLGIRFVYFTWLGILCTTVFYVMASVAKQAQMMLEIDTENMTAQVTKPAGLAPCGLFQDLIIG